MTETPHPKAMHWLGDRENADETRHAVDTTGCVLYFDNQGDCLEFMNSVLSSLPRPQPQAVPVKAAAEIEQLRHVTQCLEDTITLQVDRIEYLEDALRVIVAWSKAYPLKVFPKPDLLKARELLEAGGITLDSVSAHAMRHVIENVGSIAQGGLDGPSPASE
jgi:hypothetical protein